MSCFLTRSLAAFAAVLLAAVSIGVIVDVPPAVAHDHSSVRPISELA